MLKASWVCERGGARRIFAAVTHGIFAGKALEESAIEKIFVTNTIPHSDDLKMERIEFVSVAELFAHAIDSIVNARSISSLSGQIVS